MVPPENSGAFAEMYDFVSSLFFSSTGLPLLKILGTAVLGNLRSGMTRIDGHGPDIFLPEAPISKLGEYWTEWLVPQIRVALLL